MGEVKIGTKLVGPDHPPFVIAEMSGNHNQSLSRALQLVDVAADCGVDALKLQTFTADSMTLNVRTKEFQVNEKDSLWSGKNLYELYQEASMPWEWHEPIFKRCAEKGIVGFSTPFDNAAVDFLASLSVPCFKIASCENTDIPLIRKVAQAGKPLIISTALATEEELTESIAVARDGGCSEIILLKCTCAYPADPIDANLRTIPAMAKRFEVVTGLSDHTMGTTVPVAAVALGASVIEKHFTLDRNEGGVDSSFSLEPAELKELVDSVKIAWKSRGIECYGPTSGDRQNLRYRRSLYFVERMESGAVITESSIRAIRPGQGLPPKFYDQLLGKRVNRDVAIGTPVSWEIVAESV